MLAPMLSYVLTNRPQSFSAIISSINGQQQSSVSTVPKPKPKAGQNDATKDSASSPRSTSPLKRKTNDALGGPPKKLPKQDGQKEAISSGNRPSSSNGLAPKLAATSLNKGSTTNNSKPRQQMSNALAQNPETQAGTTSGAVAPKKGSYRDMMQRAQAAQASKPAAVAPGQIKHTTTVSKKKLERREAREQARQAVKEGKSGKAASQTPGILSAKTGQAKKPGKPLPTEQAVKKKKDRPPLEYKGTMRSSVSAPTPKPGPSKAPAASSKKSSADDYSSDSDAEEAAPDIGKRYRYAGDYTDEEEDPGYESEESSDMGGGGFDALEAEEELSLRAARKEDADALREEEAHRAEKLARRNKLAQLAAKASKPRH